MGCGGRLRLEEMKRGGPEEGKLCTQMLLSRQSKATKGH